MILEVKLKELLKERGMTQKELAAGSGIREAYISEIINNRRSTINRQHITTIINYLGLTDMNDIFVIR